MKYELDSYEVDYITDTVSDMLEGVRDGSICGYYGTKEEVEEDLVGILKKLGVGNA